MNIFLYVAIILLDFGVFLAKAVEPNAFTFKLEQISGLSSGDIRSKDINTTVFDVMPVPAIPKFEGENLGSALQLARSNLAGAYENPCEIGSHCLNGGNCVTTFESRVKRTYCNCPDSHYGKRCEFVALKANCTEHQCMNDAICYSIEKPRTVVNNNYETTTTINDNDETTTTTTVTNNETALMESDDLIEVYYSCWCKANYSGEFCEYTEAMRHCAEDRCSYHGIITNNFTTNKEGDCECECEPFYYGDRCQHISPCLYIECFNGGECNNVTKNCDCPTWDLGSEMQKFDALEIKGDDCAIIEVKTSDMSNSCVPCQSSFKDYIDCLFRVLGISNLTRDVEAQIEVQKSFTEDVNEYEECFVLLSTITEDADVELTCNSGLKEATCLNGGICTAAIKQPFSQFPGQNFLVPVCVHCPAGPEQGTFCQRSGSEVLCDAEEKKLNISMCTPNQGKCVYNFAEQVFGCKCYEGFKGERCELLNPCEPNPCPENFMCTDFPLIDEDESPPLNNVTYGCTCKYKWINGSCSKPRAG